MAEDGPVTVNAAGRARRSLTVPAEINGRVVTRLCAETFRGCTALEEVTIQSAVTALPDGLFADCPALHTIILTQPDPARLQVGQDLLAGAPAAHNTFAAPEQVVPAELNTSLTADGFTATLPPCSVAAFVVNQ